MMLRNRRGWEIGSSDHLFVAAFLRLLTSPFRSHIWLYPGAEGGKWLEQRTKDAELLVTQQLPTTRSHGANTSPPESRQAKRPRI